MDRTDKPINLRETPAFELDWEAVEPQEAPTSRDLLGLTTEDRRALGMRPPRTLDMAPFTIGDAGEALHEAIAKSELRDARPGTRMKRAR